MMPSPVVNEATPIALYPLFADLRGCRVLVVGGGPVAARKVEGLLEAGARVEVVAGELGAELRALVDDGSITHRAARFDASQLAGAWLVIVATNDRALNRRIAAAGTAARVFANVVDDAELSRFHVPARVRRGALTVAISSGGVVPALARRLRALLEVTLDHTLGDLVALLARHRERIRTALRAVDARRRFYDDLLDGPVARLLRQARPKEAEAALLRTLSTTAARAQGEVTLVGAGPGDPELLTLKGLHALQRADVVVHDRLIGAGVLDLARRDAVRIDVGKRAGEDHAATQRRIHALLLDHAQAGRHVVRLKGGDSLVFGRGGEELAFLRAHGVTYSVVPGITAALACAAYAGIPLTQRGLASSVRLATPRRQQDSPLGAWSEAARDDETLAIYMGVAQLPAIEHELIRRGHGAATPVALIENGSTPAQRVITGQLGGLAALAQRHTVRAPALLIVGAVAALAEQLAWFGTAADTQPAEAAVAAVG